MKKDYCMQFLQLKSVDIVHRIETYSRLYAETWYSNQLICTFVGPSCTRKPAYPSPASSLSCLDLHARSAAEPPHEDLDPLLLWYFSRMSPPDETG